MVNTFPSNWVSNFNTPNTNSRPPPEIPLDLIGIQFNSSHSKVDAELSPLTWIFFVFFFFNLYYIRIRRQYEGRLIGAVMLDFFLSATNRCKSNRTLRCNSPTSDANTWHL